MQVGQLGRLGLQTSTKRLTLLQQAIAAIRRNNGALFYVPQNFSGSWTDSAGTDPVNEIADVIGRMTDRTGGSAVATQATTANKPTVRMVPKLLGPNLVVINSWTAPAIGGPAFSVFNTNGFYSASKQYVISAVVSGYSGTGTVGFVGNGALNSSSVPTIGGNGTIYAVLPTVASADMDISLFTRSTNTAVFTNVVVQEVLEWSYAMSFDGSNDSLTTNITTGNEGWVCAGVTSTNSNATVVCSGAGSAAQKGIWMYRTAADGRLNFIVGNGITPQGGSAAEGRDWPANVPVVVEGWWTSTEVARGVNGVFGTPSARTGDASPPPSTLRIGAYTDGVTYPLAGEMVAQVICPVLPSAADRALIRKLIGSLQGQTL